MHGRPSNKLSSAKLPICLLHILGITFFPEIDSLVLSCLKIAPKILSWKNMDDTSYVSSCGLVLVGGTT